MEQKCLLLNEKSIVNVCRVRYVSTHVLHFIKRNCYLSGRGFVEFTFKFYVFESVYISDSDKEKQKFLLISLIGLYKQKICQENGMWIHIEYKKMFFFTKKGNLHNTPPYRTLTTNRWNDCRQLNKLRTGKCSWTMFGHPFLFDECLTKSDYKRTSDGWALNNL